MKPIHKVLERHPDNPIIVPADFPGASAIYNCGATSFAGKYLLLLSIYDHDTRAGIYVAKSSDGIHFQINQKPFIEPATDGKFKEYDGWTIDPRVTKIEDTYYIIYPAYTRHGVVGMLGRTNDFESFERIEIVSLPDNRCPVLFPGRFGGQYLRLDRPSGGVRTGDIWISSSPDLVHWGHHRLLLEAGWAVWNKTKIGPCAPPIRTSKGWLMIFHGVCEWGGIYSLSCALLDLQDPTKVVGLAPGFILTPQEPYELSGKVHNVVFSNGAVLDEETGQLNLYYGAADTCIGLATGKVEDLVALCLSGRK